MSDIDQLRHEARSIPIECQRNFHAAQFTTMAEREGHPVNLYLHRKHDRNIKTSLLLHLSICRETFDDPDTVKEKQLSDDLHADYVSCCLVNYNFNKLTNERSIVRPRKIEELKRNLSRQDRLTLTQLRYSCSPLLRDYQHKIGKAGNNLCRKRRSEVETA